MELVPLLAVRDDVATPDSGPPSPTLASQFAAGTQTSSDLSKLVKGNNNFAFNFYHAVGSQDGNVVYSPLSLSHALAMAYAGARGETAIQIARALEFDLPVERIHPAFARLFQKLAESPGTLYITDSLWSQEGLVLLPDFLSLLERNYGADLRSADFAKGPESARQEVNEWVRQKTDGKILDLLKPGAVNEQTRMVLVSAVYFKAIWQHSFSPELTQEGTFTRQDGRHVRKPMMTLPEPINLDYYQGSDYQAVALPYADGITSLVVIIPESGSFSEFERNLGADELAAILAALSPHSVRITLPKFTFKSELDLEKTLPSLGLTDAFRPGAADFSGMTGWRDFVLGQARQKVYISADEAGTEAAAATALGVDWISYRPSEIRLIVNHPFIFAILDRSTGSLLFLGRVVDPTE